MRVFVMVVVLLAGLLPGQARAAGGFFPGQFLAKLYTEALGRLPDQPSWRTAQDHFADRGCSAELLAGYGRAVFTSPEFEALGYDRAARLLALYRGALNREPDRAGFDHWLSRADVAWPTLVALFHDNAEFTALAGRICAERSYDWGVAPAIAVTDAGSPTDPTNFAGTQEQLQALVRSGVGAVALAPKALVVLNSRFTLPAGVTLTTAGRPDVRQYALMGRLVRGAAFDDQMVYVEPNAVLERVWVDGARGVPAAGHPSRSSVRVLGGDRTSVSHNKFSNSAGPSNVLALGAFDGWPCGGLALRGNVVTGYSSSNHIRPQWTDGFTVTCEGADVSDNAIVDTSDVAIVLFRSCTSEVVPSELSGPAQRSVARGNTVLSAGNPMYAAMGFDAAIPEAGYAAQRCDFTGAEITGNVVWTSPNTHFAIGFTVGSRAWYGRLPLVHTGVGAALVGNSTGVLTARVGTGIAVSGMLGATVSGNDVRWVHPGGVTRCPDVDAAASISAGTASGTFPPGTVDVAFDGCVGD
ncbi:hypothetical protein ACFYOT_11345 [Saccharothrix saharensis]|uniref:hypothetical protein n=1 Tax=Saccharothrix saharensis TaxID=571190 RepID=UPI0036915FD2